ncbi:MAG: hypothetical protein EZS28_022606, partial [Streblomastix strix]
MSFRDSLYSEAATTELKDQTFSSHQGDISVSGESNQYIITYCTFTEINYGGGSGGAFKANVSNRGKLLIANSKFIKCYGPEINGGAIYLDIANEGQVIISNSTFNQCQAYRGGGIYADIFIGGKLTIDRQCNFTDCYAIDSEGCGGGIFSYISSYNSQLIIEDEAKFQRCYSTKGGGVYAFIQTESQMLISDSQFIECLGYYGGAIYFFMQQSEQVTILNSLFVRCEANIGGGGIYAQILSSGKFTIDGQCNFDECQADTGGGIYALISGMNSECSQTSYSGGGIFSNISYGVLNVENTTFKMCTCVQSGNGGGLAMIQGVSSIISITNSSFIDCKTISNSSDQRYGWGGAIFIQTSVIAENLNETNFLLRNLVFIGCSAVNSIGNNIHIQSFDTYSTGEAIKNENLLTVKDITDLYENKLYGSDYMGIDESDVDDDNTPISKHEPLFNIPQSRIFLNPYLVNANDGIENVFCGESDMP